MPFLPLHHLALSAVLFSGLTSAFSQESKDPKPAPEVIRPKMANAEISSRSFVDAAVVISKHTTEQYAHQSALRIVKGIGYAVYQCNEHSPDENKAGQVARMAIFDILNPTASAKWVDIANVGESANGITLGGTFIHGPMLFVLNDQTLRVLFSGRFDGDNVPAYRAFYKDFDIPTGKFSGIQAVRCTIGKDPTKVVDLAVPAVMSHLNFLYGPGFGEQFAKGINTPCDFVEFDGQLYSTIQIKNSEGGVTRLMTNILMRSADQGATWELLGAPDPRLLTNEVKILAEPAITQDSKHVYLHLRTNVQVSGYVLCKAKKSDLYSFDAPVKKWTFGIGRPSIADYGKPIGMVAMFTAPTVYMGGTSVSRNKCDVVLIDSAYKSYTLAFSIVDFNAVNTPFMHLYNDEIYVTYSTGRRRLIPKFGTSEIVFSKLRREFFFPGQ